MLPNSAGVYFVDRLRVIHSYEADYNLLLGVKYRQLMKLAEANQLLHPGQYGGRAGREAQSVTLLEEIKTEITRLSRTSSVNFDIDATACYDRIIVNLASLVARAYGQDSSVVWEKPIETEASG